MRIIGGKYKGKKLFEHRSIRSTRDFVKEALFNILENHLDFEDKIILDVCAGTGAFGLEAFSRGAKRVTFIESEIEVLQKNLELFKGQEKNFTIVEKEFESVTRIPEYDIAFFDPPYQKEELYELALKKLQNGVVVIEHHPKLKLPEPSVYKKYGNTALSIYGLTD